MSQTKPKIENLEQPAQELTPEQAEAAEGGVLIAIIAPDINCADYGPRLPVPPPPPPPPPKT